MSGGSRKSQLGDTQKKILVIGDGFGVCGKLECDAFSAFVAGGKDLAAPENRIVRHTVLVMGDAVKSGTGDLLTGTICFFPWHLLASALIDIRWKVSGGSWPILAIC